MHPHAGKVLSVLTDSQSRSPQSSLLEKAARLLRDG